MIVVPVSTPEKPLTAIDYIVGLAKCSTFWTVVDYAKACPIEVRQDHRFERAVVNRLAEIKGKGATA